MTLGGHGQSAHSSLKLRKFNIQVQPGLKAKLSLIYIQVTQTKYKIVSCKRRRQRKQPKKIIRSNQPKKEIMITLYVQYTFFPKQQKKTTLNGFVVHFFAVVLHDYNVASRNFLVTRFMEEMLSVFVFTFLFPATHFHLGGRQHFSFSFMLFLRRNWSPLFFISRQLFLCYPRQFSH